MDWERKLGKDKKEGKVTKDNGYKDTNDNKKIDKIKPEKPEKKSKWF
jgi:hypothetical protein